MITFPEGTERLKNPEELRSKAIEIITSLQSTFLGKSVSETERPRFEALCQELRKIGEEEGKSYEKTITATEKTIKWVKE